MLPPSARQRLGNTSEGNAHAMRNRKVMYFGAALAGAVALAATALAEDDAAEAAEKKQINAILAKADEAYGEYLAGSCATCHHAEGQYKGIPVISGLDDTYLVKLMLDYKFSREDRTNPAMVNVAKNLSDEEIGSLARYFSKQPIE